jgi:hypothetical protein
VQHEPGRRFLSKAHCQNLYVVDRFGEASNVCCFVLPQTLASPPSRTGPCGRPGKCGCRQICRPSSTRATRRARDPVVLDRSLGREFINCPNSFSRLGRVMPSMGTPACIAGPTRCEEICDTRKHPLLATGGLAYSNVDLRRPPHPTRSKSLVCPYDLDLTMGTGESIWPSSVCRDP